MNILQIELLTNDLAATGHFYAQKMGLPVAFQNADTITFVAGSSLLTFNRTDTTAYPRYHFAFNIPHNRLEEATAWVESFAVPMDVPDGGIIAEFVSWNARAVYFYDNNGNILATSSEGYKAKADALKCVDNVKSSKDAAVNMV